MISKRNAWVAASNLFTIYWIFPRRHPVPVIEASQQSYLQLLIQSPWVAGAVVALLLATALEFLGKRPAAWLNVAYYLLAFGIGVFGLFTAEPSDHVALGLTFYVVPMMIVLLVDVWLYRSELKGLFA